MTTVNEKREQCNEVLEMTERKLPWILRRGISIIFLLVIGLLIMSCFIKYPQKISIDFTFVEKNDSIIGMAAIPLELGKRLKQNMPVIVKLPDSPDRNSIIDTCRLSRIHFENDSCQLLIKLANSRNRGNDKKTTRISEGDIVISEKYLIYYFVEQLNFMK